MNWNERRKRHSEIRKKRIVFRRIAALRRFVSTMIAGSIVLVTVLHFLTPPTKSSGTKSIKDFITFRSSPPLCFSGFAAGLPLRFLRQLFICRIFFFTAQHGHFDYSINQYAEIVIFNLVGGIMGALGDQLKKARIRAERSAEERQKAYDELQKTFEQLLQAEKLSSLGELVRRHRPRSPQSVWRNQRRGRNYGRRTCSRQSAPRICRLAKREVERLDKLVGEFLRFARPSNLSVAPVDLNETIESVVALIENQAAAQNVFIENEFRSQICRRF